MVKLTIQFSENNYASYKTSNGIYTCVTLTSCHEWEPAISISWQNLSRRKFAMFYETDTCRTGRKFFYISDVAKVTGTHSFRTPQAIRSFMIGTNDYARRRSSIGCLADEERAGLDVPYQIKWHTEGSLSFNWTDALPDSSVA